jgi:hypothetical protein
MIGRKEAEEIQDALCNIYNDLEEAGIYSDQIELCLNGFSGIIRFAGVVIWHSDEDARETTGPNEDYEQFEPFIRRKIADEVAILNSIAIALSKNALNGAELIAKERKEQIEKHGYTVAGDKENNGDLQLQDAAVRLIAGGDQGVPYGWNESIWRNMLIKPLIERLQIAGAFLAAEIDRIILK